MRFRLALIPIFLILMMWRWYSATPRAQARTACDVLQIADIQAVVGRPMYLRPTRPQPPNLCSYSTTDPFNNRPVQPEITVSIELGRESAPDPEAVENAARILRQQRGVTVEPI